MLMVKCDNKIRYYKNGERALATADARDYDSVVETYKILGNGLVQRLK